MRDKGIFLFFTNANGEKKVGKTKLKINFESKEINHEWGIELEVTDKPNKTIDKQNENKIE